MSNASFYTLNSAEIAELYQDACDFVKKHLRTSNSPSMKLAPFDKRQLGKTHASFVIVGANSIDHDGSLYEELEETFGLDINGKRPRIYDEIQPDGSGVAYKLIVPIMFHKKSGNGNGGRKQYTTNKTGTRPTLEWPMFLILVETGLAGLMYYRYSVGIAW